MTDYLNRNGKSEFNAANSEGEPETMIFDAHMTKKGRIQAEQVTAQSWRLKFKRS